MKLTPELHAKGFYEFRAPWSAAAGITYECLAIRSFEDIYKLGIDVYDKYYAYVGITNGQSYFNGVFNFEQESRQRPNIITLKGSDGSTLYIPDTFINKLPDKTLVPYSHIVLAVSLGLLPDEEDISALSDDVAALVAARVNIAATVNVCKVSVAANPTTEEHLLLESLRKGTPPNIRPNTQMLLEDAQGQIRERDLKIKSLLDILKDKGLTNEIQ